MDKSFKNLKLKNIKINIYYPSFARKKFKFQFLSRILTLQDREPITNKQ